MEKGEIIKSLKLPFQFDVSRLQQDLNQVLNTSWVPHFNPSVYKGEWTSIALRSADGNEKNIFASPTQKSKLIDTPLLKRCSYFKEVLNHFRTPINSARLLRLATGACIKPHKDHNLGYENGTFRLHIPITTNSDVEFYLENRQIIMSEGECWYTNVNFTHAVENKGPTDRVHLVLDCERNEWSDNLFFSMAPAERFLWKHEESDYDIGTLQAMISELKTMGTKTALELVANLEQQLESKRKN